MRVLQPSKTIYAYYDGRVDGYRFSEADNWVDDGAIALGIASYAIVDSGEAIVYDTHVSVEHGKFIRAHLEALGVGKITVVLSHWHLDHLAGTSAFADCQVISNLRTENHMKECTAAIKMAAIMACPQSTRWSCRREFLKAKCSCKLAHCGCI